MNQPNVSKRGPKVIRAEWVVLLVTLGVVLLTAFFPLPDSAHPLVARVVKADPTVAGKAYAEFDGVHHLEDIFSCIACPNGRETQISVPILTVYETDDYGQSWHRIQQTPTGWDTWPIPPNLPDLTVYANQLWFNGRSILLFPHQLGQLFAFPSNLIGSPYSPLSIAAPPGQGVLYAAMGQYGLLIGPNPAENGESSWHWARGEVFGDMIYSWGPETLSSNAVTPPAEAEALIIFILTIPLVFLVQAWLLGQCWRYMYPADEAFKATRLARWVAVAVSALYVALIALWVPDANANFFALSGTFAVITVVVSVTIGVLVARRRQFTNAFVWKLGIVTALLSLIVPAVVAATPAQLGWPLIVVLILGFIVYRTALRRYLSGFEARTTLWQIDRLTLEIEGLFVLMLVPILVLIAVLAASVFQDASWLSGLAFIGAVSVEVAALWCYTQWRGRDFVVKKKAAPLELRDRPLFSENRWFATLSGHTLLWLIGIGSMWLFLGLGNNVTNGDLPCIFRNIYRPSSEISSRQVWEAGFPVTWLTISQYGCIVNPITEIYRNGLVVDGAIGSVGYCLVSLLYSRRRPARFADGRTGPRLKIPT